MAVGIIDWLLGDEPRSAVTIPVDAEPSDEPCLVPGSRVLYVGTAPPEGAPPPLGNPRDERVGYRTSAAPALAPREPSSRTLSSLVVSGRARSGPVIRRHDLRAGRRWERSVGNDGSSALYGDVVIAARPEGGLMAIEVETGAVRWSHPHDARLRHVRRDVHTGALVAELDDDASWIRVDPDRGAELARGRAKNDEERRAVYRDTRALREERAIVDPERLALIRVVSLGRAEGAWTSVEAYVVDDRFAALRTTGVDAIETTWLIDGAHGALVAVVRVGLDSDVLAPPVYLQWSGEL